MSDLAHTAPSSDELSLRQQQPHETERLPEEGTRKDVDGQDEGRLDADTDPAAPLDCPNSDLVDETDTTSVGVAATPKSPESCSIAREHPPSTVDDDREEGEIEEDVPYVKPTENCTHSIASNDGGDDAAEDDDCVASGTDEATPVAPVHTTPLQEYEQGYYGISFESTSTQLAKVVIRDPSKSIQQVPRAAVDLEDVVAATDEVEVKEEVEAVRKDMCVEALKDVAEAVAVVGPAADAVGETAFVMAAEDVVAVAMMATCAFFIQVSLALAKDIKLKYVYKGETVEVRTPELKVSYVLLRGSADGYVLQVPEGVWDALDGAVANTTQVVLRGPVDCLVISADNLTESATALAHVTTLNCLHLFGMAMLEPYVRYRSFEPGTTMVHQGDAKSNFYIIVQGTAKASFKDDSLEAPAPVVSSLHLPGAPPAPPPPKDLDVAILGPQSYVGDISSLFDVPEPVTVKCTTNVEVVYFMLDELFEALKAWPAVLYRKVSVLLVEAECDVPRHAACRLPYPRFPR
ncbi:hypothetical protein DYB32_004363 [Aphanomyces invadans]|uniref:Cyclic nucleotide-binding domain-containing protein n=1 Tax=Aphanomyces invadans TaxID=157072 RepID=A0A418AXR5_9STRA|nr:hypothetical protein DYB32_004363 [Aphanomyces invadans]